MKSSLSMSLPARITLAVFVLWIGAFTLSCRLDTAVPGSGPATAATTRALLTAGRKALSAEFYEEADTYFHRGVPHIQAKAFEHHPFQQLAEHVTPTKHVHTHGQEVEEIMPWLELAIQSDVHNVDAYLVAAFWLSADIQRPDVALQVLLKAQRNNPSSYRVPLEKGRLYLKLGRYESATSSLRVALSLWNQHADPEDAQARLDLAAIQLYRALLLERNGDIQGAIGLYEGILRLYPERTEIRKRLTALRSGRHPEVLASTLLSDMLREEGASYAECGREQNEHHEHGDVHDAH